MKIEYARHPDTGIFVLEESLAEIGKVMDTPGLIDKIGALDEGEVLRLFSPWPDLAEPEGVWGAMRVGDYAIMCQLHMPPAHERHLGAEPVLKIDRAGTPEDILRRLRELERGEPSNHD
jgi:hypothetical protein